MFTLDHVIAADQFDSLTVIDMGDGCISISQTDEDGNSGQIAVSWDQLRQTIAALEPRYGAKNTDQGSAHA